MSAVDVSIGRCLLAAVALLLVACGGSSATPPSPSPPPAGSLTVSAAGQDREISFESGADTIHASLRLPQGASGRVPGVLLIAGSGPTDRNGNSPAIAGPVNTLAGFADVLAQHGVASLRYDKVGSGATGLASFAGHPGDLTLEAFVQESLDGLATLRARPEIDPGHIAILGHSEGGLIALITANRLPAGSALRGLVLTAPLVTNEADLAVRQLQDQYDSAAKAGAVSQAAADQAKRHLDAIGASLAVTGTYPSDIATFEPPIRQVFNASAERFLAGMAQTDGLALARSLPAQLPVMVLRGTVDEQIPEADIQSLVAALRSSPGRSVDLIEPSAVDHVFKEVQGTPSAARDYGNPSLPFSHEAAASVGEFVDRNLR